MSQPNFRQQRIFGYPGFGFPGFGFGFGFPGFEYESPVAYHPHTYLHPHFLPGLGYGYDSPFVLHPHSYIHPHPVNNYWK
jgi:hypothetical protein